MRTLIVGRHSECDVTVDDPTVSRRHAEIELLEGGQYILSDAKSSSGTYILGKQGWRRISRAQVKGEDKIRLGRYEASVDALLARRNVKAKPVRETVERNPQTGEIVVKSR